MASGAGFKTFTNGSILADTDLNDYLMTQTVIKCTSGTRPSSPHEGMLIYEADTDRYSSYNGGWLTLGQNVTGAYTSTLTASTTNPTLGTGGLADGRWTLWNGKWCTIRGDISFGSSGVNAGSGQYLVALPFTASASITHGIGNVGSLFIRDTSAGPTLGFGVCYATASATAMALYAYTSAASGGVRDNSPFTWAASDYISFTMVYEIA